MRVLVLNSGSSSQKSALYELGDPLPADPPAPIWHAEIDWSTNPAKLHVAAGPAPKFEEEVAVADRRAAIEHMLATLWSGPFAVLKSASDLDVVGHRIVHGGHKLEDAVVIDEAVKRTIASVSQFAPLHNRAELDGVEMVERLLGQVPQVAVFDTGFHRTLPMAAAVYPGPYEWFDHDIRRYGFHGINYQYCVERTAQLLKRDIGSLKIVACHLGNGCSVAAIDGGRSVDTSMGFTPLEGLMMGTRSGSIDPGILTYLMREQKLSGNEIDHLLNKKSGLLGVSGLSADMRPVVAAMRSGNQRAQLAFDIFVHRLSKEIAAMSASLGGMDVLVFTGGIGEHSAEVRAAACEKLRFMGIEMIADDSSVGTDRQISSATSKVAVLVIHAEEDWMIAKTCVGLVRSSS